MIGCGEADAGKAEKVGIQGDGATLDFKVTSRGT